ncbi:acyl-CoA dehydrogenase family member 11 isoform X2 [Oncorhynchus tshawytscha]|uniref:acyl-CoA dehydrogenase family member 11 isoform X2 n=1 Tax=Oncorhynchus tshawytscha TaxID=74940 RepID=UPI000D09B51F|nr:acyl-CoA dehydrogenase family member 11 isoform X2 [Oncorhynchus tshawytscha]
MTSSLSDNAGRLCPPRPGQCQCSECCPVWPECGAVGPGWAADCRKVVCFFFSSLESRGRFLALPFSLRPVTGKDESSLPSIGLPPSHRRPWHQRNGMKERANFSRRLLKVNGSSGRCLSVWLLNLTGQQKHCASSWMGVRFIMVVGYRSWTKSEG